MSRRFSYARHTTGVGLLFAIVSAPLVAQTVPTELAGAKDHPLVSRYTGATLQNTAVESFAAVRVPAGPGHYVNDKLELQKGVTAEGKVSAFFYVQPRGRSALEVFRNYQAALGQAGFAMLYSCEMQACDQALIREPFGVDLLRSRKWASTTSNPAGSTDRDVRFLSARTAKEGAEAHVMVFVAEPNSIWQAPTATVVVVEASPVELGKVAIGSDKLRSSLADDGRVALYGLYFDTGRSEVKPESKPQLDEMARLLTADRALKVTIVGHTDSQGAADANLALSQRRAEAVVAALVSTYRIDAARLRARGVASFSPVATNRTDAGRAKNRRVELVE